MGTSLSGLTPATTFDGLLKVGDNDPLTADLKAISTGDGTDTILQLSDSALQVNGDLNVGSVHQVYQDLNDLIIKGNSGSTYLKYYTNNGNNFTNQFGIGNFLKYGVVVGEQAMPTTGQMLRIKGSGSTSATTSLLVQNSAGADALVINDDLETQTKGRTVLNNGVLSVEGNHIKVQGNSMLGAFQTPTARLQVKGSGNGSTTTSLLVQNSDDTQLFKITDDRNVYLGDTSNHIHRGVYFQGNYHAVGDWNFGTTSDLGARVGIKGSGATSATTALLVQNSAGTELLKVQDDGRVNIALGLKISNLNVIDWDAGTSAVRYFYQSGVGNHVFYTNSGTERMKLNNNGNLGIGESNPTARLQVKGSGNDATTTALLVQNSDGADLFDITDNGEVEVKSGDFRMPSYKSIYGGGSSTYAITLEGTTAMNFKSWAKDFAFNTQNGTIATLKNDGKFGLGETAPTAKLHIKGDGTGTADYSFKVQNAIGNNNMQIRDDGAVFLTNQRYTFNAAGGAVFKGSGATSATSALLVENSAGVERLKVRDDGWVDLPGVLNGGAIRANTLQVDSINFKVDGTNSYFQSQFTNNVFGGVNTDGDASALVTMKSTTQGFLPPRMTDAERDAIATPAAGLMIYDTSNNQMNYWNGSTWIAF